MKRQSVDILNEADSMERKLAWTLFKQEIAHIWDPPQNEDDWVPGEPMFDYPLGPIVGQQCARYMFEEQDLNHFNSNDEFFGNMRCTDCDVFWDNDEPCFACGQEVVGMFSPKWFDRMNERFGPPPPSLERFALPTEFRVPRGEPIFFDTETFGMNMDVTAWLRVEMRNMFDEVLENRFQEITFGAQRAGEAFRGLSVQFQILGESMELDRRQINSIQPSSWTEVSTHNNVPTLSPEIVSRLQENNISIPEELLPIQSDSDLLPARTERPVPPWQVPINQQRRQRR